MNYELDLDSDCILKSCVEYKVDEITPSHNVSKTYMCVCGKELFSSQSFNGHKSRCNTHRQSVGKPPAKNNLPVGDNKKIWNKGKTKLTDPRLIKLGNNISKALKGIPGHKVSEETKLKISATCKINKKSGGLRIGSGIGYRGYYKGYYCRSSWEFVWLVYHLDNGLNVIQNKRYFNYIYKDKMRKYYPDFIIDNQFYEIKGYWSNQFNEKVKQFPKDETLHVIDKYKIQQYIDYCEEKYGENYWIKFLSK